MDEVRTGIGDVHRKGGRWRILRLEGDDCCRRDVVSMGASIVCVGRVQEHEVGCDSSMGRQVDGVEGSDGGM